MHSVRRWRGPRLRPAQRVWPVCAALAAQLGRPTQRAAHGASVRRHCPAARGSAVALLGELAAARHRRTGDGGETTAHRRGDGGGERRETASDRASAASDRGDRDGGTSEASGWGVGGAREAVGRRAARARRRSGASSMRRLSSATRARRGSCQDTRRAVADRWGPLSAISELKFTLKEISSN
jgi:hypothetical protein